MITSSQVGKCIKTANWFPLSVHAISHSGLINKLTNPWSSKEIDVRPTWNHSRTQNQIGFNITNVIHHEWLSINLIIWPLELESQSHDAILPLILSMNMMILWPQDLESQSHDAILPLMLSTNQHDDMMTTGSVESIPWWTIYCKWCYPSTWW